MERKNTVLLTVIAVATLLVAVVGATFAYFTATTNTTDNSKGTATIETTSLAQIQLTAAAIEGNKNVNIYPGTSNFIGASVKASKTGGEEGKNYEVSYTISGKVAPSTAFTKGSVTYKLYKTTEEVTTPVTCPEPTPTTVGDEVHYTRVCTINSEKLTNAVELATGNGDATDAESTFTYTDKIAADDTTTHFYYLIATYENKAETEDQSEDATKSITLAIDSIKATSTNEVAG